MWLVHTHRVSTTSYIDLQVDKPKLNVTSHRCITYIIYKYLHTRMKYDRTRRAIVPKLEYLLNRVVT